MSGSPNRYLTIARGQVRRAYRSIWLDAPASETLCCLQPHLLDASRAGVGACLWDSAFVLTAFLGKSQHCLVQMIKLCHTH